MPTLLLPRVSIVTGAGSGIGKTLAAALARRGSHVVVADIDAQSAAATVEAIDVNLRGVITGSQAAYGVMLAQGSGTILNTAREDRLAAKGR